MFRFSTSKNTFIDIQLINSKIIYCLESWGNVGKTYMDQIYLLQKRLVRIIYKQSSMAYTKPHFTCSSVLPVHLLYKYKRLLIAYQTFYSTQTHSHHNYLTRASQHNLDLPSSTTAAGHRTQSELPVCFFVEWFSGLDLRYWGGGWLQACPKATPAWFVVEMFFLYF